MSLSLSEKRTISWLDQAVFALDRALDCSLAELSFYLPRRPDLAAGRCGAIEAVILTTLPGRSCKSLWPTAGRAADVAIARPRVCKLARAMIRSIHALQQSRPDETRGNLA